MKAKQGLDWEEQIGKPMSECCRVDVFRRMSLWGRVNEISIILSGIRRPRGVWLWFFSFWSVRVEKCDQWMSVCSEDRVGTRKFYILYWKELVVWELIDFHKDCGPSMWGHRWIFKIILKQGQAYRKVAGKYPFEYRVPKNSKER